MHDAVADAAYVHEHAPCSMQGAGGAAMPSVPVAPAGDHVGPNGHPLRRSNSSNESAQRAGLCWRRQQPTHRVLASNAHASPAHTSEASPPPPPVTQPAHHPGEHATCCHWLHSRQRSHCTKAACMPAAVARGRMPHAQWRGWTTAASLSPLFTTSSHGGRNKAGQAPCCATHMEQAPRPPPCCFPPPATIRKQTPSAEMGGVCMTMLPALRPSLRNPCANKSLNTELRVGMQHTHGCMVNATWRGRDKACPQAAQRRAHGARRAPLADGDLTVQETAAVGTCACMPIIQAPRPNGCPAPAPVCPCPG